MRFTVLFAIVCLTLLQSCKTQQLSQKKQHIKTAKSANEKLTDLFDKYQNEHQLFSGLMVVDAESNDILFSKNEDKYFTPASNTKLFTLLAAQHYLADSIPALLYSEQGDSLIIKGTGDPTFLTKNDIDSVAFHFLTQTNKKIYLNNSQMTSGRFGSGWSWDDYPYYYQKENSDFPIAGQATCVAYHPDSTDVNVSPRFMERFFKTDLTAKQFLSRSEFSNLIIINPKHRPSFARVFEIPFYQDSSFSILALSQLLGKDINYLGGSSDHSFETLYQMNSDSLYKELMLISDNFIAEQLLFLIGSKLDMELNTSKIIISILEGEAFASLPGRLRWVDGSGLSRYNLASPRSMVWALEQLEEHLTDDQIQSWFPSSDHQGTLPKGLNRLDLHAKTGTLSNNFCLSGFLTTSTGKRLRFSWMNNHFMVSKNTLVDQMAKLLQFIQEEF